MSDSLSTLTVEIDRADSAQTLTDAVQALADACLVEAVPILVEALSYNNPGAAVAAVDGLVKLGEPAVAGLLEQLDLNNYTARSWAIRALAGIGDPRGLVTLLGAATADISMSVRRAAARGLGAMKWHWFPKHLLEIAQAEALDALLFVAQSDEEWVVRYAAVVGLEALSTTLPTTQVDWHRQIQTQLETQAHQDESWAVRARSLRAQQYILEEAPLKPTLLPQDQSYSSANTTDWEQILDKLYRRKVAERTVLSEGDPAKYRQLLSTATLP